LSQPFKLEITNIYKDYQLKNGTIFKTLENLNMQIKSGEFVSLIGPSGSGKSTLFNLISGLELPSNGDILLDSQSIINKKGLVSYMPQKDHLLPWRTILENVILGLELAKVPKEEARKRALLFAETFGLKEFMNEYPSALSGGMRQRAALLRTALLNNDVLLLDEPFGALDEITRMHMQQWLLSIWEKLGNTILFVTHSIDEAILLSDRVYVFSARPATVKEIVNIPLSRPRKSTMMVSDEFIKLKKILIELLNDNTE